MHTALADFLGRHRQDQFRFLRELVLQPSYTRDKEGVDAVAKIIIRELATLPMSCMTVEQSEMGNHLVFRSAACGKYPHSILLAGHMDTVFPPDSGFAGYHEEGDRVFGPGVIDMKGGLATAVFALKALHGCGLLTHIPVTLICNSDEEIGSPTSKDLISHEAKASLCGMVFECGGLNGEIVTGRKGKTGYNLEVTGRAGHAAFSPPAKASAILELAYKIIAIEQLNDPARQLVVNVGTIRGGIGPNTVPDFASAQIDTRYLTAADGQRCQAAIHRITERWCIPDTHALLTVASSRDPMEQSGANTKLYEYIHHEAEILHLPLRSELRSGVSDANTIAAAGTPVIDGLGPIGDCDHSSKEYMIRASLMQRTLLAASSIAAIWQGHTQESCCSPDVELQTENRLPCFSRKEPCFRHA